MLNGGGRRRNGFGWTLNSKFISDKMFTSYAQNFEDVILWRALKHVERGFYIDVGAWDPVKHSVSFGFYEQGWRGVHVEPVVHYAELLRKWRPGDEIICAAVSTRSRITFCEIPETGLSTGDPVIATDHKNKGHPGRKKKVRCLPLSEILDRYKNRDIHWLKIDVEGMEQEVIHSWPPSLVRPWIVLVESTKPLSQEASFATWDHELLELGYEFVYFDGLNRFYVSHNHRELAPRFGLAPNLFDNFVVHASTDFCSRTNSEALEVKRQLTSEIERLRAEEGRTQIREADLRAQLTRAEDREGDLRRQLTIAADREIDLCRQLSDAARREVAHDNNFNKLRWDFDSLQTQLRAVYDSTSWRITAPLRFVSLTAKWLVSGTWSWITLKPGSRPRRVTRRVVADLTHHILARPRLAAFADRPLMYFPTLRDRLRTIAGRSEVVNSEEVTALLEDETESTRDLYRRLVQVRGLLHK